MHPRNALATLALLVSLPLARAQDDGIWTSAGGGSWANPGNWLDGTIANGTDSTATFGINLFPINTSATFTLNGARTIGSLSFTAQSGPDNWILNTGTGGPLTLDDDIDDYAQVTVSQPFQQVIFNVVLAGVTGLEKFGNGTLILTATNTYTGGTVVSGGTLLVNGKITDANAVTVAAGTLGGTGMISGPVTVQSGGFISPGSSPGTLTISNSLTLQAGSKAWLDVNASTLAHDFVTGISSANYGGTLIVSNLAGTPALGQSFPIFSAASPAGNFSTITPQLTGAVRWRFDPASGVLSVVTTNSQPKFSSLALVAKTNLVFNLTNGVPGGTNYLLASTNLILLRTNWTRLMTNIFDPGGNLVFTNSIGPAVLQRFFQIMAP